MKFASFATMGLMGCALALPHGTPDGPFNQPTPSSPPPSGLPTPLGPPPPPRASGPAPSGSGPTGTPSAFPEPSSFGDFERRQDFGIIPTGVPFSIPSGFPTSLPSGIAGFAGIDKRQLAEHRGPPHRGPVPSVPSTGVPQPSGGLPSASGVPFGFPPSGPAPSGSSAPSGFAPAPRV